MAISHSKRMQSPSLLLLKVGTGRTLLQTNEIPWKRFRAKMAFQGAFTEVDTNFSYQSRKPSTYVNKFRKYIHPRRNAISTPSCSL